jgi:hypothetical protein
MNKQEKIKNIELKARAAIENVYRDLERFPWTEKRAYASWLAQSYYYVSHTTRLLALAAARLPTEEQKLHLRFLSHLAEEKGHEKLCSNDLKGLGYEPANFPELPQTSALYHSVYYLIEHRDPCAILGYAMILEGISATKIDALVEQLTAQYSKSATSFLRLHCEADKEHTQENKPVLESCNDQQLDVISEEISMIETEYRTMLHGIRESLQAKADSKPWLPALSLKKAA